MNPQLVNRPKYDHFSCKGMILRLKTFSLVTRLRLTSRERLREREIEEIFQHFEIWDIALTWLIKTKTLRNFSPSLSGVFFSFNFSLVFSYFFIFCILFLWRSCLWKSLISHWILGDWPKLAKTLIYEIPVAKITAHPVCYDVW